VFLDLASQSVPAPSAAPVVCGAGFAFCKSPFAGALRVIDRLVQAFQRLSPVLAHAGPAVAGVTFTYKMLHHLPNDPFLWGVYMASVGGCAAIMEWIRGRQA
jgi:hypothetical protein